MIRINLLKSIQFETPVPVVKQSKDRRKQLVLSGGGLAIVVLVGVLYMQHRAAQKAAEALQAEAQQVTEAPGPGLDSLQPKRVTANAVEETVRDVGDQSERQAEPPAYFDMVPSVKIEYQYFACTRILRDIKAVTPAEVGFANFIFTPPGDFYVHGLVSDVENFERFKQGLASMRNTTVRPGKEAPAGTKGLGKEFSFYGTVNYPINSVPTPVNHVLTKAKLQEEVASLKTVAANLGIKIKEMRQLSSVSTNGTQRLVYQITADCSFQQMQDFVDGLQEAKSDLGFLKFALHARGDDKVVAEMDILAYVN